MMTFLMSPLKRALLPRQEVAETVVHALWCKKSSIFFCGSAISEKGDTHPANKIAGAARVGRSLMKGGESCWGK